MRKQYLALLSVFLLFMAVPGQSSEVKYNPMLTKVSVEVKAGGYVICVWKYYKPQGYWHYFQTEGYGNCPNPQYPYPGM